MWKTPSQIPQETSNPLHHDQPDLPAENPSSAPEQSKQEDSTSSDARKWDTALHETQSLGILQKMQVSNFPVSTATESPLERTNASTTDRIFPIRSVVSVDLNTKIADDTSNPSILRRQSQPIQRRGTSISSSNPSPKYPETAPWSIYDKEVESSKARGLGRRISSASEPAGSGRTFGFDHAEQVEGWQQKNARRSSEIPTGSSSAFDDVIAGASDSIRDASEDRGGLLTARFKHIVTEGGHAVIIGRDEDGLQRCEDEPIHIPGAVQSFGMLVALQEEEEGKLRVKIVSENSRSLIGYTPKQLFALDSFCDILSEEQTDNLLDHIDFVRDDDTDPATNGPEVFTLAIRSPQRRAQKMWCAMHINDTNRDLIICEFELEDDQINPLVPADDTTPEPPEDTLQSNPTPDEYAESTVNSSKPLRVLRRARHRTGEAAAMEVFNIMSQVQEQLANAPDLETFLKVLVGVVKELTGFHRVMIYQFDQYWNGKVVTELVDPRAMKDLYKGLNFPASDIPKQARDLYKINKVRLLYDRDQETARLVCRTVEYLKTPLDLTFAYLRAISPIHIKYLANMAVRASMSISINAFDELWGLIACHSYGSKGMRVSFPIRKMCRLIGDSASRNIERLSYASRLQARKLISTVPNSKNPSGYIIASSEDLLSLFDADCGLLSIRGETKILGKVERIQEALALREYLHLRKFTSVMSSSDIRADFPDLRYEPGFYMIAGLLLVPLSIGGKDFIVFFRKGQIQEVKWAGNPYEKILKEGTQAYLEPRKSFKTWSEMVVGRCREWTEEQFETAAVLCLVYGKFIAVWREKEAALQNSQLTKLLLANSAHEVRTPLNAIINYLEIALEGALDQETRENLSKSHSASKSLIYVINDLLDLTKTEEGHNLIEDEVFDLLGTVREATDIFLADAKRKQIKYEIIETLGVPQYVIGDQRRVRQVISNVTANAIKHTSTGSVKVELWVADRAENRVDIDIVIEDTGEGMSVEKLDRLFRDLEQVQDEPELGLQEHTVLDSSPASERTKDKKPLGLGLALVARIIRNMNGQLRLKSEEGKGSRFVIQIGFDLPKDDKSRSIHGSGNTAVLGMPSRPPTPLEESEEVMLVNKTVKKRPSSMIGHEIAHHMSNESLKSMKSTASVGSFKSGLSPKSEVDRLLSAFQESHIFTQDPDDSKKNTQNLGVGSDQLSGLSRGRPAVYQQSHFASKTPVKSMEKASPDKSMVHNLRTSIGPIQMPNETSRGSPTSKLHSQKLHRDLSKTSDELAHQSRTNESLHVLVAEDDPVNSKIVKKRLEKMGHLIYLTSNGEECCSHYIEKPALFDVVLMDMQMPIVDGLTSTKMIRSFEKSYPDCRLSDRATLNRRIPIFAVSASLIEKDRPKYIDAGFDGWILKPIDFKRLSVLLSGIVEENTRESCVYQPGGWERGGWFVQPQRDIFHSPNILSSHTSTSNPTIPRSPLPLTPAKLASGEHDPFDQPGAGAAHADLIPSEYSISEGSRE